MNIKPLTSPNHYFLALITIMILLTVIEFFWPIKKISDQLGEEDIFIQADIPKSPFPIITENNQFHAFSESPLFTPDRKPFIPVQPTVIAAPAPVIIEQETQEREAPSFEIQGLIRTPTTQLALIKSGQSGEVQRVKVNDFVDGWEVIAIESNVLSLRKEGEELNLNLVQEEDSD